MSTQCTNMLWRCTFRVFDTGLRMVGPVLILLATSLILMITTTFFVDVLPLLISLHGIYVAEFITLIGLFILFNIIFNYYMVVTTSPGSPPSVIEDSVLLEQHKDPELVTSKSAAPYRFCRPCNRVKPMRTHHCSVCKCCVKRMDHHCPWINNCVGFHNHKYFILFLIYVFIGCFFFLSIHFEQALSTLAGGSRSSTQLISVVMCFSIMIASALFCIWSLYLAGTNQTTIEFYGNNFDKNAIPNPYNIGILLNLKQIFGSSVKWYNWMLPYRSNPPGNGMLFPFNSRYLERYGGIYKV